MDNKVNVSLDEHDLIDLFLLADYGITSDDEEIQKIGVLWKDVIEGWMGDIRFPERKSQKY